MADQIGFERLGYEHRIDALADRVHVFVAAVLGTIDEATARGSPGRRAVVCRFFAGCAAAARLQRGSPESGGDRIADYLAREFPYARNGYGDNGGMEGFEEMMDWLSDPAGFRPTGLRQALGEAN